MELNQLLDQEFKKSFAIDWSIFIGFFAMFWVFNTHHSIFVVDLMYRNFAYLGLLVSMSLLLFKSYRNFHTFSIIGSVTLSVFLFAFDFDNVILRFFWDELDVGTFIVMFDIHGIPPIDFIMLGLLGLIFASKSFMSNILSHFLTSKH